MPDARQIPSKDLSRRSLLAFAAGGAALSVSVTAKSVEGAPAKMSQQAVAYQSTPKNEQWCDACVHFQPPSSCEIVEGGISPSGWCKMFRKKP